MFYFDLGKYVDSYDNPFFYWWIFCSVISSIYTYTWDVKMDWGLFNNNSGEYAFLRDEIVYDNTVSIILFYLSVKYRIFNIYLYIFLQLNAFLSDTDLLWYFSVKNLFYYIKY